tara:strand:- start:6456 stop:6872 length:417 start_codon:yes stop_codon:yes gene_type:complete
MDILIKTSDGSEVNRWNTSPGKVGIPGTTDVVFPGDSPRPIDIGPDHFLATATVVDEAVSDSKKRGPQVLAVDGKSVTVTSTVIDKTADDLSEERKANRVVAYGSFGSQLDMLYWDGKNGTTVWADHIATVKAANPKP